MYFHKFLNIFSFLYYLGMSMLCSDKTGTLTMNKMVIQEETPIYKKGETQYSILRYAAMAAKWKEPPRDALGNFPFFFNSNYFLFYLLIHFYKIMIDTMVLTIADLQSLNNIEQTDFVPFDPVVKRTEATIRDKNTKDVYKITKGAPHILMELTNSDAIRNKIEIDVAAFGLRGIRCLAVAKTNDDNKWEVLGLLTFLDPPRFDTKETIHRAMSYGVEVKMITGDHLLIGIY